MTRRSRIAGLLIAYAIAAQAAAGGGRDVLVCRFTGHVIENCPCPERTDRDTRIEAASCCELRKAPAKPAAAEQPRASLLQTNPTAVIASTSCACTLATTAAPPEIPPETSPPVRDHLYVKLRQLLI